MGLVIGIVMLALGALGLGVLIGLLAYRAWFWRGQP